MYDTENAIRAFTLMKVIGRDIWIGIWCLILSVVSVMFWERNAEGARQSVGAGVIWERFPKFVLGFFAASVIMSVVSAAPPSGYMGVAKVDGTFSSKAGKTKYSADFSAYAVPEALANKFQYQTDKGVITFAGGMSLKEFNLLRSAATTEGQRWALTELKYKSDWFESELNPKVIAPIKKLRSWAFVLCFLCIGLSTRFAELAHFGLKPFWAFTIGVLVNVPLGYFLSTVVFSGYWSKI